VLLLQVLVLSCGSDEARTTDRPPLGWSSWYGLGKEDGWPQTDERTIKEIALAMVATGLRDAGYTILHVDDSWQSTTREAGKGLQADKEKFPNGMKAVANFLHARNLTLGLYTTPGRFSCAGEAGSGQLGSYGFMQEDIDLWIGEWGVGYLKNCICNTTISMRRTAYADMRKAIDRALTRRSERKDSVIYECSNFMDAPWRNGQHEYCNVWRVSNDVPDNFDGWNRAVDEVMKNDVNRVAGLGGNYGGRWSSFDFLQIGSMGQTLSEYRAQMSLWSILAAPIFIGADVRKISKEALDIYTNPEVLAVSQDPAGIPGYRIARDLKSDVDLWIRPLSERVTGKEDSKLHHQRAALLVLNRSKKKRRMLVKWSEVAKGKGMRSWRQRSRNSVVLVRDVWKKQDVGRYADGVEIEVDAHAGVMLVLQVEMKETSHPFVGLTMQEILCNTFEDQRLNLQ